MREEIMYPVFRATDEDGMPTGSVYGADDREICESLVTADDIEYARRIAACLNACRDISTEDLELCGNYDDHGRNWMLRHISQDAMFRICKEEQGE